METQQLYARGKPFHPYAEAEKINALDIYGITGRQENTMQALIDSIANMVANRLLEKAEIADWAKQGTKPDYTAQEVGADSSGSAEAALANAKAYADEILEMADRYTDAAIGGIADWAKNETKPGYTAQEVGADPSGSADTALEEAKSYADIIRQRLTEYIDMLIGQLVNGAPEALNTLKEIADTLEENATVVEALQAAIGSKAASAELLAHTSNGGIHIKPQEREQWNSAKDKIDGVAEGATAVSFSRALGSGEKIGAITIDGVKQDIYAPRNTDTTYQEATANSPGLMPAGDKEKLDGMAAGATRVTLTKSLLATVEGSALDAVVGPILVNMINAAKEALTNSINEINGNLSSIENLVLSDPAITINNLSQLDGFRNDGLHTICLQAVGEPFVKGGLYLLEVKTQTFTLRSAGYVQTMTRIFPVTDNTTAAIIATRTMYNSYKGKWITVC